MHQYEEYGVDIECKYCDYHGKQHFRCDYCKDGLGNINYKCFNWNEKLYRLFHLADMGQILQTCLGDDSEPYHKR